MLWGALAFMLMFLVIGPTTRAMILDLLENARLQIAVATPLSYFLIVIVVGSAVVSAIIMAWWPKRQVEPVKYHVTRRYTDPSEAEIHPTPAAPGPWLQLALDLARCVLPVRMAAALEIRFRDYAASSALKRQLGA